VIKTRQKLSFPLEELRIEAALVDYIGRKNTLFRDPSCEVHSLDGPLQKRGETTSIRRAAFVAYWLSKCVFGEHPAYSIKPLYFPIAVKISAGACFPLAPLLLGQLYT
jgi:hypothetical protein